MKLIMEAWRKFAIDEVVNVGLDVKSDKDKEMLINLANVDREKIKDFGDMIVLSFNSEESASNYMSNPQVSVYNPKNIPQKNLDAVEAAASQMNIEPGEGDIRHTRADGSKYRSKMRSGTEEEPSVEFDFGGERGVELVTPERAEFLKKMRKRSQEINRIQTQQDAMTDVSPTAARRRTMPDNPRVTKQEIDPTSDTISTPAPSMSKKRKTVPYSRA